MRRVSGASPTHADSYDIDIEVPAPITDQATATLLQNLNSSREIEQVSDKPGWRVDIYTKDTHHLYNTPIIHHGQRYHL